ncbi:ATP:cob(I)alamin adenosyltransferase [bacterium CG10_46_32]|nr:MAG: ATP:cob(I)alamin adenosyltransferase [bacterium CG10_46_32]PIR56278.1 MAG: ATP:cob(I)alamin adenosyltransferase [Parcubacteria group bacterium CG10_big_fil_rev_8_21_14_0_10_46_32]
MGVVTKTGDKGDTARFGGGRVSKNDPSVAANGDVDELNSAIGLLSARVDLPKNIRDELYAIQSVCFTIGAEIATPEDAPAETKAYIPRVVQADIALLEERIDALEPTLPRQKHFILPSGAQASVIAYWIRAIVRRAERSVVGANNSSRNPLVIQYLNRLSDYFYIVARFLNHEQGVVEEEWRGGAGPLPPKV